MTEKITVPTGLGKRGRRFWTDTLAEFDVSRAEQELLEEVCRCLDEIDALRAIIAAEGVSVPGHAGQPRPHPALAHIRATRSTTARLLAQLALPDPEGQTIKTGRQARSATAHRARWGRAELATRRRSVEA